MSNRFLLSLHHASVILLPNSASPPLDTATRCGEEGKRETSLREEATGHRGLFTREFNLCVLLYSNEQVCRVQSTKHEENVQRCSRYSSLPVHTLLSRKVFSPVSYLRRRSSRVDGAVPIFFSSLLFFTDFRSDCQFQAQWKYILHLFNPEKGNVESIFLNME